jgi:hypothetical protein
VEHALGVIGMVVAIGLTVFVTWAVVKWGDRYRPDIRGVDTVNWTYVKWRILWPVGGYLLILLLIWAILKMDSR